MSEPTSYLKNLKFDPKLRGSFFARYLANTRLVILLVLLVTVIGITSFLSLSRVLNPKINIPIVTVSTTLQGSSPDDIESLITIPIEDSIEGIENVKKVTSSSQDSNSIVSVEFESGVNPDKAKADVQSAVDGVTNLPTEAQRPIVTKLDFENEPVWTFAVSSKDDALSLSRFSRILKDRLEELPTIDKVEVSGVQNEEIQIILNPQQLASYNINPTAVSQAITAATGSQPAGTVSTKASSFVVSLDPTVSNIDDLRKVQIQTNQSTIQLSDIATIQQHANLDNTTSYYASNTQKPIETIRFDVYKTTSANITSAVEDATKKVAEVNKNYNSKFTVSSVLNNGEDIDRQYNDLVRDFMITVALVFIALFLFLGIRQAMVASFAIPLTFLITFTVMNLTNLSLSFIAFFSLLLSLGLLVDDTIVIISALTAYYRTNKFTPLEAGLLVWRDFGTPILTTTLTTVWAFVPLLLSTGIIGEFIKPIPIVVSSTLIASLLVAVLITLPLIIILLQANIPQRVTVLLRIVGVIIILVLFWNIMPGDKKLVPALLLFVINLLIYFWIRYLFYQRSVDKRRTLQKVSSGRSMQLYLDHGVINFAPVEKRYRKIIDSILANRKRRISTLVVVIVFSLFAFILLPLGYVRNEFFPPSDVNYLYLSLEMPAGTNSDTTRKEMLQILNEVKNTPDVSFITATPGLTIDPGRGYQQGGNNVALFTFVLPEKKERNKTSMEIAQSLRDHYKNFQSGTISVIEASEGPPAGSDLQIKISGEDLTVLDTYADKLQSYLKQQANVTNVSKSIKAGTSKLVFVPNYQQMISYGVTQQQIGQYLRTYATGLTINKDIKLQKNSDEKQNIVLRTSAQKQNVEDIATIAIPTQNGIVPLTSLASFKLLPNPTLITREDGKRTISVSASVTGGLSATEANTKLEQFANNLHLPDGYSWATGGVNEENQNSVNAILIAMVLSFFLIIITMVLQFSSFRKALIVMLVIPLSISGVFIIFALSGTPLSFPALIGVLALFGIVVKNAILVVDKINQNIKQGMMYREAIVDAAESRLEPITLTSCATILGLIPISLSDPLWRGLGGAIISGLAFSGTVMLFFIPVVYYMMFEKSEGKRKKN